jgi:hypothetical protein
MGEVAHHRGRELGLSNVDHRVIEAERIELDSGSDRRRALVVAPGRTLVVVRRPR